MKPIGLWPWVLSLGMGAVLAQQTASPPPVVPSLQRQPPVTFRVETNLVEVDAIVTDQRGAFVGDLDASEFQILEDGKPQEIAVFLQVRLPVVRPEAPLFAGTPVEPDVATNAGEVPGRLYVIVLDDLHTHPLRSARVKTAVRQFLERHFGTNDVAALIHTSGRTDAGQEFTSNRRLLLAAVDKFVGRKTESATVGRIGEYFATRETRQPGDPLRDPYEFERAYHARSLLTTIRKASELLAGIHGRRKALLLVSEGIDYDIYDVFNAKEATSLVRETQDAIGAATLANVSIYGIDPRGLTSLGDEAIEIAGLPDDPNLNLGPTSLLNELRLSQDSLRVLAEETGGLTVLNTNDAIAGFQRIVEDNSAYYILGYRPTNDRRDGRYRRIEVRVSRPGLHVRARRGYVAPRGRRGPIAGVPALPDRGKASARIREVLGHPIALSGLPIRVAAAAFKGTAPSASVAIIVEVDAAGFAFVEREGRHVDSLEVALMALDHEGKVRGGDASTINLTLRPETYQRVRAAGVRSVSRLDLPAGRYQLRVAVREANADQVGSVHYDLEVPDFFSTPFGMSGIVVTSAAASRIVSARGDDGFKGILPAQPTTLREFQVGDLVHLFVEVYDHDALTPHGVEIVSRLRRDGGTTVFEHRDERSSAELKGASGGYGYTVEIPLGGMQPGLYVLTVEARSRLRPDRPVTRDILLRIVGEQ